MNVASLMSTSVVCAKDADMCDQVAGLLWSNDLGAAPVLDGENHVAGMITDRDLCMAAYTQGRRLAEIPVRDVMTKVVFSVAPDEPVANAEEIMGQLQLHRLPVVQDERVVGMITTSDLARVSLERTINRRAEIGTREVAATLARITTPRQDPAVPPMHDLTTKPGE